MKSSLVLAGATLGATSASSPAAETTPTGSREFYELRKYHLRRGPMQKRFDDFVREAALPAFGRAGVGPVGVFSVMAGPDSPTMYVLIPHRSPASLVTLIQHLREDDEFLKTGSEFINADPTAPSYVRMESSFMIAFAGMPKLEVPAAAKEKKPRIFELRIYESHSEKAHFKKVEMFDQGEIAIFRRTGLTPVFFGQTVVGRNLPNLTYMLVFENLAAREKNWGTFGSDPEWRKLSTTPGYTDPEIVSNISNVLLRPTAYSQI